MKLKQKGIKLGNGPAGDAFAVIPAHPTTTASHVKTSSKSQGAAKRSKEEHLNPFAVYSKLKNAPKSSSKSNELTLVGAGKMPRKLSFRQRRDSYRQLSSSKREREIEAEDNVDSLALAPQLSGESTLKRTMQKI